MRKKIYRLSEGQFDREKAALTITPETIDVTVRENVAYEGSFTVSSDNNVPLRGVVYSSQPYVVCQTPAFEGEEVVIRYKFIHDGFRESDEIKGAFTLICDGQTKMVPYSFKISAAEISSSMGPIRDMEGFCALAEQHWNEALTLFHTQGFERLMARTEYRMLPLYRGYRNALPNSKNLEGFLVAIGAKPRVRFDVSDSALSFF